jgi:hypothetical protein
VGEEGHAAGCTCAEESTREHNSAGLEARVSTLREIRVEPNQNSSSLDWNYGCRYLSCATEIIASAAHVEAALYDSEPSGPGFPRYSIRKATLHLKTLVSLHPGVERDEHLGRCSANGARCSCDSRTSDAREKALVFGNSNA